MGAIRAYLDDKFKPNEPTNDVCLYKYDYCDIFALFLILQKAKGSLSDIYEYINTLPDEYTTRC